MEERGIKDEDECGGEGRQDGRSSFSEWGLSEIPEFWKELKRRSVSGKFIRLIVDNGSYIFSVNTSVFNSTAPFMIGAALTGTNSAAGSFFTGAIDNVVFWNEILTANDLSLVWNNGNVLQV